MVNVKTYNYGDWRVCVSKKVTSAKNMKTDFILFSVVNGSETIEQRIDRYEGKTNE